MLTFSCGSSAYNTVDNEQNAANPYFKIISAEKTHWIGGRVGVRGTNYNIKIKKSTTSALNFSSLYDEGHLLKVIQKNIGGELQLTAAYAENPLPNVGDSQVSESGSTTAKPYLNYTVGNSKTVKKYELPSIKEIKPTTSVPTYPKTVK